MNETEWGLHGASTEMKIFREVEQEEKFIDRIAAAQREELELETAGLQAEARAGETAIGELVGSSSIYWKIGSETHPTRPAARRRSHATGEVAF